MVFGGATPPLGQTVIAELVAVEQWKICLGTVAVTEIWSLYRKSSHINFENEYRS